MAVIFITGSSGGLGQLAAAALIAGGHRVFLHARNTESAHRAVEATPGAAGIFTADLTDPDAVKNMAMHANRVQRYDAVIHNAGVYRGSPQEIFKVNTLAPYLLTCLMERPQRLVYLSSGLHFQGTAPREGMGTGRIPVTYADSKLFIVMFCRYLARKWPAVYANAVDPGWVPTRMGGRNAPDDLRQGYETQVWLASGQQDAAGVTGQYFHHRQKRRYLPLADDNSLQDLLVGMCAKVSGVPFPS